MDQRICIKFCVKNKIKCSRVCEMLIKAYGKSAMSKTRIYKWYKRFKDGREDVEDDGRPGRPSTSKSDENVEKVREMVMNDHRITIREVADGVGISIGSCHEIFSHVLGRKRVAGKLGSGLLNYEKKPRRIEVIKESLDEVADDAELLKRVTTARERWFCGYDVEAKTPSPQWRHPASPRQKEALQARANVKVLLTEFFDLWRSDVVSS